MAREPKLKELVDSFNEWSGQPAGEWYGQEAAMTNELYPYDSLFSPIKVNRLTIKNRIVMAPMGNINMAEETGRPAPMMLEYFFERAKGGAGLLTTGLVPVSHGLDATVTELGELSYFPRLDRTRTVLGGWRDLAQGVHAYGSRIFVQLTAGLGRVGNPECLIHQKKFPQSASANPNYYIPDIPSLRMSDRKLSKIIKSTGQHAATAKAMGIDGVYLHGHEGYLIDQMTNPAFNRRKLGKYADWKRFGLDMVREIRERTGKNYPIMYRIDLSLALEESYSDEILDSTHLGKFRGGRTIAQTLEYIEDLIAAGVDLIDVDLGCYDNWWLPHPPGTMPAGCFVDIAQITKEHLKKKGIKGNSGAEVPIVAVGKLGYPDLAERALREDKCDMVMLGRPLLADPEWPKKAYAGKTLDILPCIGCQEACVNEFVEGGHPQCAVNPRTSFEYQFPKTPPATENPKKIAVVGAGPAGIMCAHTALQRGHQVTLFEKTGKVGGRLNAGSVARVKFDVANYLKYLNRTVEKDVAAGLEFRPNTEVTTADLAGFDTAVIAVGTDDSVPPIPQAEGANAVHAVELFKNPDLIGDAKKVVVLGGGVVGTEVAQWLAYEHGVPKITVVEMMNYFMKGACTANRGHLIQALRTRGVQLLNAAAAKEITAEGVSISRNTHKNVPNPYNVWSPVLPENVKNPLEKKPKDEYATEFLPADLVVFATGGRPQDQLYFATLEEKVVPEVHNIGDSFAGGRIWEAVKAGYRLGLVL